MMMDRIDAAGLCVSGAYSHQSSNLSLRIHPAECVRVSSGHIYLTLSYCSSLSSSAAHYEKPVYVQIFSEIHCEPWTEKRWGRGCERQRTEWRKEY